VPVVELEVDAGDAELAADALWQAGPTAVSEVPARPGKVRLIADVADVARIPGSWPVQVVEPDDAAHLDAWRAWAVPQRAGRRLLLQPAWLPLEGVGPDDLVVRLDPGRSFGSGSHPSTRLVLAVLEDELRAGDRVLDVGCGSGVLAVAACLLGAAGATAIDVDPGAPEVTRRNAAANGVAALVDASRTPVEAVPGTFDVVLANIGVRVLRELARPVRARVAPGGLFVLAGLLEAQADELLLDYEPCVEVGRRSAEGWTALVLRG
jgi:ribosomal protein L11 methyltransferase